MLKKYHGLIGYEQTGISEFGSYGQDTYEVYLENLKSQPSDWYYRNNRVLYHRNSYGHRSCEPSVLQDDYIMFVGCSITVGSAVELEKTFPHIVSSRIKTQYYNLAVEGAGYDMISYNVSQWINNFENKPKAVVFNWPQMHRSFREEADAIIPIGPWSKAYTIRNNHLENFSQVSLTDYFEHYSSILRQTIISFLHSHQIKTIEVGSTETVDYGRDLKHPGILSHSIIAENIINQL